MGAFTHLWLHLSVQAMQAKGLSENTPHTIGDAANAYAAATLAGISCCSNDWDALDTAAVRSCTPEPGMHWHVAQLMSSEVYRNHFQNGCRWHSEHGHRCMYSRFEDGLLKVEY